MFLALGVAAGAFVIYLKSQGTLRTAPTREASSEGQQIDLNAETAGDLGPGKRPWIRVYGSDGRLQYRFGAEDYAPRGGGRIDVRGVETHFFQYVDESKEPGVHKYRTQQVRIHGTNGTIEVQQEKALQASPSGGGFDKGSSGPPKRGLLNDVTIYVISRWTPEVEKKLREPGGEQALANIIATTPNISFDNETFEITTHEYTDADGHFVPADQVPVHATGDYEFNGRGMTLRWNQIDGRLEYLEVAHGNYLVVRDTDMLGKTTPGGFGPADGGPATRPSAPGTAEVDPVLPLLDLHGQPIQYAAAGKAKPPVGAAGKPAAGATGHKKQKGVQPPYRATFDDTVTIAQGEPEVSESQVAEADVMQVEFQPGSKGAATRPASQPTTKRSAAGAKTVTPANVVKPAPADAALVPASAPATAPASRPTLAKGKSPQSRPTTGPSTDAPLIIRWNGRLRVVPIDDPSEVPPALKPGESIVHLIGEKAPVRLTRDAMQAWCTVADYFSTDGSAQLRKSDKFGPIRLKQMAEATAKGGAQEADIVTQQLNYSGTDRVAVLHGESTAHILLPQQPTTQPTSAKATAAKPTSKPATQPTIAALDAAWTKIGRLYFAPSTSGAAAMSFDHAELEGDVDVKHPQMALRSQKLNLFFEEKPATRPTTLPAAPATEPAGTQPSTRPANQSILKRMVAIDRVWCDLADSNGRRQTVTTDLLTMSTSLDKEGKLYPQFITADGKAHAYDGQQDLQAGHLALTLAPSTRPTTQPAAGTAASSGMDTTSVELQEMRAWNKVSVRNAEGSTAHGDWMKVNVVDGQPIARIIGSPLAAWTTYGWIGRRLDPISRMAGAPLASVTDAKGSRATGPIIDFDPRHQWAKISGRGTIRAIQAENKPTTRPSTLPAVAPATRPAPKFADIFWEHQAELDGAKNLITVIGPVLISSIDADGTRQTATGHRAVIELIDRPATQPTTKPASNPTAKAKAVPATTPVAGKGPTTQTARGKRPEKGSASGAAGIAGGGMDVLKDKVVSAFNLEKDAVVNSTLSDAKGILRQTEIRSNTLRYETGETATSAATKPADASPMAIGSSGNGRLIAPGPGTMIYRDHRPATRPADGSAPPDQARGATAFRWDKGMTYDQPKRLAVMDGNVLIVNQPDQPDAEPVRVNGDRVEATFEPKPPAPAVHPTATKPVTGVQTASNTVRPASKPAAGSTGSDPGESMQLKWLTISGNVMMNRAGSTMTADRADYNPATGWLVAKGTRQAPATFSNADGSDITWADEVHWNTQTWIAKFIGLRGRANSGDKGPATPGQKK
jgi:lipopolysaccharide export system protein LptA